MKGLRLFEAVPPAPLRIAGAACGGALLLASVIPSNGVLVLSGVCLLLFFLSWLLPPQRIRRTLTAGLCFAALALGLFGARMLIEWVPLEAFDGAEVTVQGQVERIYSAEDGAYVIRVKHCAEGIPEESAMLVWLMENDVSLSLYDEVTLPVRASKLKAHSRSWASDGIFLTGTATDWAQSKCPEAVPWYAAFSYTQQSLASTVQRALPGEEGALIAAVCLGDRSALSDKTEADFRRAGLTHLMCVSGLHVTSLVAALVFALRFLNKRLRAAIVTVAVWGFVAVVGFPVSAVRAGVLCTVLLAGQCLRVRADGLSSLGLAFVLLMVNNPFCIYDVGLLLSFGACLGLMTVTPQLKEVLPGADWTWRPLRAVRDSFCVTIGASVLVTPVLAVVFGEVYLLSPVSNLLAVFPATVMLVLGCGAMLLGAVPFLAGIAEWLTVAAGWIARFLLWLVDVIGSIPFASVPLTQTWSVVWVIGAVAVVVTGLYLLKGRGLRIAAACVALAFSVGLISQTLFMRGVVTVTVADCGDTVSAVIAYRGRTAVLLVDGTARSASAAEAQLRMMGREAPEVLLSMDTDEKVTAFVQAVHCLSAEQLEGGAKALLWEDITVSSPANGWLCLAVGDTCMLIAAKDADAQALPRRDADVLLFSGAPPLGSTLLSSQHAVVGCDRVTGAYIAKQLAAWPFPCEITGGDGAVTVHIRTGGRFTVCR